MAFYLPPPTTFRTSVYLPVPQLARSRSPPPPPLAINTIEDVQSDMLRKASAFLTSSSSKAQLVDTRAPVFQSPGHKKPSKKRSLAGVLSRASSRSAAVDPSISSSSVEASGSTSTPLKDTTSKLTKPLRPLRPRRSLPKWEISQNLHSEDHDIPPTASSPRMPYIQGYSAMSLDNDLQTSELLRHFYPSASPTFHQFSGTEPPRNILDLGCGKRGTWVIEAAAHWRTHHTKVTGLDLVEPDHWRVDHTIKNNVRFIKGDFLNRLPFDDQSFDFVRMANLGLCIPQVCWPDVLEEVCRVLRPDGVLEVIDDELLWPYLQALPTSPVRPTSYRSSIYQDDCHAEDKASGQNVARGHHDSWTAYPDAYDEYDQNLSVSTAMEEMFEKMIWFKHGVHPRPHEFIQDRITNVFGQQVANENNQPCTFKAALPLAGYELHVKETKGDKQTLGSLFTVEWEWKKGVSRPTEMPIVLEPGLAPTLPDTITSKAARRLLGSSVPTRLGDKRDIAGLLLYAEKMVMNEGPEYPGKFAPMDPAQMEMSICRNIHMLLSCKKALTEYICEVQEGDNAMTDEEISSAFWSYECFRRTRFNLPHTLNELKMEVPEETAKTSNSRLSTDSFDSGYSSVHSRNGKLSKTPSLTVDSQEPDNYTCVRVIRVFKGTKAREPTS